MLHNNKYFHRAGEFGRMVGYHSPSFNHGHQRFRQFFIKENSVPVMLFSPQTQIYLALVDNISLFYRTLLTSTINTNHFSLFGGFICINNYQDYLTR